MWFIPTAASESWHHVTQMESVFFVVVFSLSQWAFINPLKFDSVFVFPSAQARWPILTG